MANERDNGRDGDAWGREDVEHWILSHELGAFERFLDYRRAVMRVAELQQQLREQIDQSWERGEGTVPVEELQRRDDVVSNIIYGMIVAKMMFMGQRTSEHIADDVREYVENGSLLSDPDTIEASLRSFDFVDPDAAAPHEAAPEG